MSLSLIDAGTSIKGGGLLCFMCPNLPSYSIDSVMQVFNGSITSVYITYNVVFNTVSKIKYIHILIFQLTIKPLFFGI